MPSSAILRGSRSLIRSTVSVSSSRVCPPRSLVGPRKRLLSSVASDSSSPESPVPPENAGPAADPPEAAETATEEEKPRVRRTRIVPPPSKDTEPVELPQGLDILWSPADEPYDLNSTQTALPPPEVFEEALHHLHITLHPQTQHRAVYPSTSGPPVEPTFGLYCPIEGGDYIIDTTVRELARRTNAEVLVIDAVQLAAEEWGQFGKGICYAFQPLFSTATHFLLQLRALCNYPRARCTSPCPLAPLLVAGEKIWMKTMIMVRRRRIHRLSR